MKRAVFLDRDGVINHMVYHAEFGLVDSPARPEEFALLPGVGAAVRGINELGLLAIVISNQPGIAKGKMSPAMLEETKRKMIRDLGASGAYLDAIYYCLHHPEATLEEYRVRCSCRKPKPGLLLQAAEEWGIDLAHSYFVGDGVTDMLAGRRAGCVTIMANSRKCYICDELSRQQVQPDFIAKNLMEAVQLISALEEKDQEQAKTYTFRCSLDVAAAGSDDC